MDKKAKIATILALLMLGIVLIGLTLAVPRAPKPECNDKIDNDGDGLVDRNDLGCSGPQDPDETNCGDGVCEGGETSGTCPADCGEPDSCSDTDGGNVITVFGTTSGYYNNSQYSNDDYCVDSSNIMEYYCSGDYEQSSQQSCGTDFYGSNYCINSSVYRDYTDYSCSSGECDYTITPEWVEDCDYGCTDGTCDSIPDSCTDSDGGYEVTIPGMVYGYSESSWYAYNDTCLTADVLGEWLCLGDEAHMLNDSCSFMNFTSCSSGTCI